MSLLLLLHSGWTYLATRYPHQLPHTQWVGPPNLRGVTDVPWALADPALGLFRIDVRKPSQRDLVAMHYRRSSQCPSRFRLALAPVLAMEQASGLH